MQLPYDLSCPSVGWSVGCHNFLKGKVLPEFFPPAPGLAGPHEAVLPCPKQLGESLLDISLEYMHIYTFIYIISIYTHIYIFTRIYMYIHIYIREVSPLNIHVATQKSLDYGETSTQPRLLDPCQQPFKPSDDNRYFYLFTSLHICK